MSKEFKARYGHLGAGTKIALASAPSGAAVSAAVDRAISVLSQMSGEGSVLRRVQACEVGAVDSLRASTRSEVLVGNRVD